MGFRHLYGFNLAMLGKQGWRLTTNNDTIMARIFKARYYPRGSFLEAPLGHNPSFIWRSIHASQVIVKGGLRWRLGDGKNIRVWQDAWLREEDNSFITTPITVGGEGMHVSDLMVAGGREWNRNLISQIFNNRDAQCILSIPLFSDMQEDVPCWKLSRSGDYSVKSAYYYTMENLVDNNHLRVEGKWQSIWELKIPNKVKVFLWRAARKCLPTRQQLRQKGVNCPHTCAHCPQNFENDWHLFFGCRKAQQIWEEAGLWSQIDGLLDTAENFVSLFFDLFDLLSQQQVIQFAIALWCIWKRRNQKIWEEVELQPSVSFQLARDVIDQWKQAQERKQHTTSAARYSPSAASRLSAATPADRTMWQPPGQGIFKCNVDAAIFKDQNCYGAGMCIRDDRGNFIRAKTLWNYGNPLPHEAEAWGLKSAILWLRNLGYSSVVIELNCKLVVDGITGKLNFRTEFGTLLHACKTSLVALSNFRISFIRRQANNVAHYLARAALSFASHQDFDYIPSCIEALLMNEMN